MTGRRRRPAGGAFIWALRRRRLSAHRAAERESSGGPSGQGAEQAAAPPLGRALRVRAAAPQTSGASPGVAPPALGGRSFLLQPLKLSPRLLSTWTELWTSPTSSFLPPELEREAGTSLFPQSLGLQSRPQPLQSRGHCLGGAPTPRAGQRALTSNSDAEGLDSVPCQSLTSQHAGQEPAPSWVQLIDSSFKKGINVRGRVTQHAWFPPEESEAHRQVQSHMAGKPGPQPPDPQLKGPGGLGPMGFVALKWGEASPWKPAGHTGWHFLHEAPSPRILQNPHLVSAPGLVTPSLKQTQSNQSQRRWMCQPDCQFIVLNQN